MLSRKQNVVQERKYIVKIPSIDDHKFHTIGEVRPVVVVSLLNAFIMSHYYYKCHAKEKSKS